MRQVMLLVAAVSLAALVGCSSSPSAVGRWHSDQLPDANMPPGAESATVHINEDGSFTAYVSNGDGAPVAGIAGMWKHKTEQQLSFDSEGDVPHLTGQLLDSSTLLVTGDGVAVRLDRVE